MEKKRRMLVLGTMTLAVLGGVAKAVETPAPDDETAPVVAAAAPISTTAPTSSEVLTATSEPTLADASTVVAVAAPVVAPTPAFTGTVQACDQFHVLVDDDGDTWGECVNDLAGAHTRAQTIVSYLGLQELTCVTDPSTAASTCEALTPDGAVRTLVIELTGDISRNDETRPAPTTTTAAPPPPPPVAAAAPSSDCDPNYTPCVPIDSDVDCASGSGNGPSYVRGPVQVIGSDIYGLDRDGDGVGCEG